MKLGLISQRVDEIKDYGEVRDGLDTQWHELFKRLDAGFVPLPNQPQTVAVILERLCPDFIVLSGGNNPVKYGGNVPGRDAVDDLLIEFAVKRKVPLLGVCRGMQSIGLFFGGTLKAVEGHVATRHIVTGVINREVNSYHGYALDNIKDDLEVLARDETGVIEAVCHKSHLISGIMWHPERVNGFDDRDVHFIKERLQL